MAHTVTRTEYSDSKQNYEATIFHPGTGKPPVVLVFHAWAGQSEYEHDAARRIADMGYVAVAVDVYGVGKRGSTVEENQALMNPLVGDRAELQSRLKAAVDFAKTLDGADTSRVAVIGFCFGGLCVLDVARMGADVKGVVSFHGIFAPAPNIPEPKVKAKVLALHGWEDPMAKPDDVKGLAAEMTRAGADWQLVAYGHTSHAFTNPAANAPEMGLVFNPVVCDRSYGACQNFLDEVLA